MMMLDIQPVTLLYILLVSIAVIVVLGLVGIQSRKRARTKLPGHSPPTNPIPMSEPQTSTRPVKVTERRSRQRQVRTRSREYGGGGRGEVEEAERGIERDGDILTGLKLIPLVGEVHVPSTMVPYVMYTLNAFLIGDSGTSEMKTIRLDEVIEKLPFNASSGGPVIVRPHGEHYEVTPAEASLAIPRKGMKNGVSFDVSHHAAGEGPTKLFVDFVQNDRVLRQANADIAISRKSVPGTLIIQTQVEPFTVM
jgi:hypothetical protein